ncbi:MAG: hypothetical protein ACE5OR_06015 [bacterium]
MEKLTFIEVAKRVLEEEKKACIQLTFGRLLKEKDMTNSCVVTERHLGQHWEHRNKAKTFPSEKTREQQ